MSSRKPVAVGELCGSAGCAGVAQAGEDCGEIVELEPRPDVALVPSLVSMPLGLRVAEGAREVTI